jgi:6-pyruvoyl-tetrahydropterin synthase
MLSLIIRTSFTALHCWAHAPQKVGFLSAPHAHQFNVAVKLRVNHTDREQEFFIVKREIDHLIAVRFLSRAEGEVLPTVAHSPSSCESIAAKLAELLGKLSYSVVRVEVQEDAGCSGMWEEDCAKA